MEREPGAFSVRIVDNGSQTVVALGELDMNTAPELESVLDTLIEGGLSEIVLDVSGLSFIDSSGIAALIAMQKHLNELERRLVIKSPRPIVTKVFEITGLMDFLNVQVGQSVNLE